MEHGGWALKMLYSAWNGASRPAATNKHVNAGGSATGLRKIVANCPAALHRYAHIIPPRDGMGVGRPTTAGTWQRLACTRLSPASRVCGRECSGAAAKPLGRTAPSDSRGTAAPTSANPSHGDALFACVSHECSAMVDCAPAEHCLRRLNMAENLLDNLCSTRIDGGIPSMPMPRHGILRLVQLIDACEDPMDSLADDQNGPVACFSDLICGILGRKGTQGEARNYWIADLQVHDRFDEDAGGRDRLAPAQGVALAGRLGWRDPETEEGDRGVGF